MNQATLLDQLAIELGSDGEPASDYRIAKVLGCSRQHISQVRSGIRFLSEQHALRLAELAKLDPGYVLNTIAAAHAKSDVARRTWLKAAERLAAVFAVVAVALVATDPLFNDSPLLSEAHAQTTVYYVK